MDLAPRTHCPSPRDVIATREDGLFCHACDRPVLDLTRSTRREAEARVREALRTTDRVCRRVTVDADSGEPIFVPEPPRHRVRLRIVAAVTTTLAACAPDAHEPRALTLTEARIATPPRDGADASSDGGVPHDASPAPTACEPAEQATPVDAGARDAGTHRARGAGTRDAGARRAHPPKRSSGSTRQTRDLDGF